MAFARKPGVTYLPAHVKQIEVQPGEDVIIPAGPHSRDPVNIAPLETWLECERCRRREEIKLPIMAAAWVEQANAFGDRHSKCRR